MNFYDSVKSHVVKMLRDKAAPTKEEIRKRIGAVVQMFESLDASESIDQEALLRDLLTDINIWQPDATVIRREKHINWLPEYRTSISWGFWKRYAQYLEEEKNWTETVRNKLDKITDDILGDIGNPAQSGPWDLRGMVVGDVQGGKTANYTGLICKAVDAGYKLIIVLAGMTNDLRSQTQSRLDKEFLGFESEVGKVHSTGSVIGVGKIASTEKLIAHPLTFSSKDGDFKTSTSANLQLGGNPLLLVVKKHGKVLQRIHTWVENQGKSLDGGDEKIVYDIPLLLLDDEADNASVNTSPDDDPTKINGWIRRILKTFQQKSYVAYTATPYANIFIAPDEEYSDATYGDDLFPRDFVYHMAPPSHYIGPIKLFGLENLDDDEADSGLPLVREVEDANDIFPQPHKKVLAVESLPDTLLTALHSFFITCAARRVRGQVDVHNSMLVHVTRYNMVQEQVLELVSDELANIKRTLEYNTGKPALNLLAKLKSIWEQDYIPTINQVRIAIQDDFQIIPLEWESVRAELLAAVSKIEVRGINGDIGGVLDYDNYPKGLNVIAVGGDKLSRGLTLEGLSVSYYLRPAKNYDTLLQMGRWFGYRPGYVDLCRLFSTPTIIGWYKHITIANEELRRELNFMSYSKKSPKDYGLKVRTSPDGLSITAANKIRSGKKLRISFSGHLAQTTIFAREAAVNEMNFRATENWLRSLGEPEHKKQFVWENVSAYKVMEFLDRYTASKFCPSADSDLLNKYIKKMHNKGELKEWTVVLVTSSVAKNKYTIADLSVGLIKRTPEPHFDKMLYKMNKSNILSPEDEQIDLEDTQKETAFELTLQAWKDGTAKRTAKKEPIRASGPFIRSVRSPQKGLLLLYPLDPSEVLPQFTSMPIIGHAVSFPLSEQAATVEYTVNTTYWQDHYGSDDDDEN